VLNLANLNAGDSIVIIGVGGVGLSAVLGAKMAGAGVIAAIDRNESNLGLASRLGATHTVNSGQKDVVEASKEIVAGGLFGAAIEAAGRPELMELAISLIRDDGTCVIAGNPREGARISVDPFDLIRGKTIVGSWGGGAAPDQDIPRYVEAQLSGEINFSPLIGTEYGLHQINDAVAELTRGTAGRVLLRMGSSTGDGEQKS